MGSNSNRSETRTEKLNRFSSNIRSSNTSNSNWQTSKGAEIRGSMGVEKGNAFIADIKKYR